MEWQNPYELYLAGKSMPYSTADIKFTGSKHGIRRADLYFCAFFLKRYLEGRDLEAVPQKGLTARILTSLQGDGMNEANGNTKSKRSKNYGQHSNQKLCRATAFEK